MIILGTMFLLIPRFMDPSGDGESEKQWVSARVLAETGGFPVYSHGPFYCVYLLVFRLFDYPLSVRLEYIATHFFAQGAIFLMLLRFLSWPLALFLSCAWIPYLAVLDPGAMVLGIAFICLYFRGPSWEYNQGYFPVTLLAGALCHSAFLPFLAGHTLGEVIQRRFSGSNIGSRPKKDYGFLIAKGFLILLAVLTIVHPSKRWDHNHMFMNPTYCPIPLKDALTIGFFQIGTWKEVVREVPQTLWISQDWYFSTPRIFKGAHTIWEAVIRSPDIVGKNILENMGAISVFPRLFITGHLRGTLALISIILFFLGLIGIRRFYGNDKVFLPEMMTLITGSFMLVLSLLLTWFAERYMMALLPVGLFCLCFTGRGAGIFLKGRDGLRSMAIRSKTVFFIGVAMIGLVLFYNPFILGFIFHHGISHNLEVWSVGFDILLLVGGGLLMADSLIPQKVLNYDDFSRRVTAVVVFFSACIVLLTASYEQGTATQIKAVIKNEGLFDGVMNRSYRELLRGLRKDSKVFLDERLWVKAFGPLDLDNIYDPFDLPPYEDKTGKVRALLNSLDAIWITFYSTKAESSSTNAYLRYRLHVGPFLKDVVQQHRWFKEELPEYGTIYRRGMAG